MKVFISQPMAGRSRDEIEAERDLMLKMISEKNPDADIREILSYVPSLVGKNPLYSLGYSIQMLSEADVAVFAPGWENARGCRFEHWCCREYDIDIVEAYVDEAGRCFQIFR